MAKTVTVRLPDESYEEVVEHASADKRSVASFIELAIEQYIKHMEFTDDEEVREILENKELLQRMKRGSLDARKRKGKFIK